MMLKTNSRIVTIRKLSKADYKRVTKKNRCPSNWERNEIRGNGWTAKPVRAIGLARYVEIPLAYGTAVVRRRSLHCHFSLNHHQISLSLSLLDADNWYFAAGKRKMLNRSPFFGFRSPKTKQNCIVSYFVMPSLSLGIDVLNTGAWVSKGPACGYQFNGRFWHYN